MNKLTLLLLILVFMGSCSKPPKDSNDSSAEKVKTNCIETKESVETKALLETEIRGQVKFLGESETFNSIASEMSAYKIPALSLAVIHQGEIEWAEIYTNADFPEGQDLDCSSIFQAASLSKPVTLLAAVRMHASGEIDLDENIQNYLEDYVIPEGKQTPENPVTFRNIFAHTSGITPGGYQGYAIREHVRRRMEKSSRASRCRALEQLCGYG